MRLSQCIEEYKRLWKTLQIRSERLDDVDAIVRKIVANRKRYQEVSRLVPQFPWYLVGALHSRESSLSFAGHASNGDPLTARTRNVPAGRIPGVPPPYTWEQTAVDVYKQKAATIAALGIEGAADTLWEVLHFAQAWNGFGYENGAGRNTIPESTSPFLWSFSTAYVSGKYAADNKFRRDLVDAQAGVAVIIFRMAQLGHIYFPETDTTEPNEKALPYEPAVVPAPFPADATAERGNEGPFVLWVIRALVGLGLLPKRNAIVPYVNAEVEDAVRKFQRRFDLEVDGVVGSQTRLELEKRLSIARGNKPTIPDTTSLRQRVYALALAEASKGRVFSPSTYNGEVDAAYLDPLRPALQKKGHWPKGNGDGFFDWCACWVTGNYRKCGIKVPDVYGNYWATVALTDAWVDMAKRTGAWKNTPAVGDAGLMDWDGNGAPNHIGIVLEVHAGWVLMAEGNAGAREVVKRRELRQFLGFVDVEKLAVALGGIAANALG
jgi:lysozyme family protein